MRDVVRFEKFKCFAFRLCPENVPVIEAYPVREIMVGVGDRFYTAEDIELCPVSPMGCDNGVLWERCFYPFECGCEASGAWDRFAYTIACLNGSSRVSSEGCPKEHRDEHGNCKPGSDTLFPDIGVKNL